MLDGRLRQPRPGFLPGGGQEQGRLLQLFSGHGQVGVDRGRPIEKTGQLSRPLRCRLAKRKYLTKIRSVFAAQVTKKGQARLHQLLLLRVGGDLVGRDAQLSTELGQCFRCHLGPLN